MRVWEADGMLMVEAYFYESRPISKKKYLEKCRTNPELPVFADEKVTNTLGNYMRRLRKERREQVKWRRHRKIFKTSVGLMSGVRQKRKKMTRKKRFPGLKAESKAKKNLAKSTRAEALRLVKKIYALGAIKIWATGIESDGDESEYSKSLIIILPDEKEETGRDL